MPAVLLCSLLGLASRVTAQNPAQRVALTGWQDSLAAVSSLDQARELERQSGTVTDPTRGIRRSMAQSRIALLRGDPGAILLAMSNLRLDAAQHHDWIWPDYTQARLLFDANRNREISLPADLDPLEQGWGRLHKVLQQDPEFEPASQLALELITPSGDREFHSDMVEVLRILVNRPFPHPDALLDWGRYHRTQLTYDSALYYFNRAAFAGSDRSRLGLERARTLMALGDTGSATQAYWDGLIHLTATGREFYSFDLAWIVTPDTLRLIEQLPNDSLLSWLKEFWRRRDAEAGKESDGRLRSHLARWVVVNARYRSHQPWRRTLFDQVEPGFDQGGLCVGSMRKLYQELALSQLPVLRGDIRFREFLYDHRGLIYLRHGPPQSISGNRTAATAEAGEGSLIDQARAERADLALSTSESWIYWYGGAWQILHFQGSQAMGNYGPTTLKGVLPTDAGTYQELGKFIPAYANIAAALRAQENAIGSSGQLVCENEEARSLIGNSRLTAAVAIHTDSDSPPLRYPWRGVVRAVELGDFADGTARILLSWAFPYADLKAELLADGVVGYPVDLRTVIFNRVDNREIRVDTTVTYLQPRVTDKGWVYGLLERPIQPGLWGVSFFARQDDSLRGSFTTTTLDLEKHDSLRISDVLAGREGAIPWTAPDGKAFPFYPLVSWPKRDGKALLYYEVRGLATGDRYSTTIEVFQEGEKNKALSMSFDKRAGGPVELVRSTLELNRLDPGNYLMVVRVRSGEQTAERTVPVSVLRD